MSSANAGGNGQAPTQPATPAANGQAPTPALTNNDAAGTLASGAQNGQAPAATSLPTAADMARMTQELAESRRDAAKYRADLQKVQDSQLTAEQKRERDFGEMQTKYLELTLERQRDKAQIAAFRLAPQLGIADVGLAIAAVMNEHGGDLAFDEKTNEPTNLEKLLAQVLKDHPGLAAQAAASNGQQPGQQQSQQQAPLAAGQYQRPPVQSGAAMNPGASGGAPVTQNLNRPLRTFNDVEWKR